MPTDTYSSILGWLMMATGNDNNSWGTNHNNSVSTIFENSIAGVLSVVMSTGTLTNLNTRPPPAGPSAAAYAVLSLTGTGGVTGSGPYTATTLQVPNLSMRWIVQNGTNGDVVMQTPSGTPICIPVGTHKHVWCDGSNGLHRHDANDIGEVKMFANGSVPAGFVEATGASLPKVQYPDLNTALGTTWGAGDTYHFATPLLNDTGRYIRSRWSSGTVGSYLSNQFQSHTHTASSVVTDPGHTHTITDPQHTHTVNDPSHSHSITDPHHNHTFSDPGHNHGVSDPGHNHSYSVPSGSENYPISGGPSAWLANLSGSASTGASGTNIGVNSNTTGGSVVGNATGITGANTNNTGITNASASTGITGANSNTTGISVATTNTAVGGTGETRPETAIMIMAVRY